MDTLVRSILASYPRWWRERYGAEVAELTADLLAEPGRSSWRFLANLVLGVVLAWAQIGRRAHRLVPLSGPNPWGTIPAGGHCDVFFNKGLSVHSGDALEPDEVLLGVMDGWRGSSFIDGLPVTGLVFLVVGLPTYLLMSSPATRTGRSVLELVATWGAVIAVGSLLRWMTSSRSVSVAVTNKGLVVLRRSRLTSITGAVIERLPAAYPVLVRHGLTGVKVALGDHVFSLTGGSEPLLAWMARSAGAAGPAGSGPAPAAGA